MEFADHTKGTNLVGNPKSRTREMQMLVIGMWSFTWNTFNSREYITEGAVSCVAEASTLDANRDRRPRNQCPCCDNFFQKKDMIVPIIHGHDEDAEVCGWKFRCPTPSCKAHITIFND